MTFIFREAGASLASAFATFSVKDSLRRLPAMTAMLYGAAMGGPFSGKLERAHELSVPQKDASASILAVRTRRRHARHSRPEPPSFRDAPPWAQARNP